MGTSTRLAELNDLLGALEGANGHRSDELVDELVVIARECGLGGRAEPGAALDEMREDIAADSRARALLVSRLSSGTPLVRSWTGGFIEALFEGKEARSLVARAVQDEQEPNALSWLCLSLARLHGRGKVPDVCRTLKQAYDRAAGSASAQAEILRARGYAGCVDAQPALAALLRSGGVVQQNTAIDGLRGHYERLESTCLEALWHTFTTSRHKDVLEGSADLLAQYGRTAGEDFAARCFDLLETGSAPKDVQLLAVDVLAGVLGPRGADPRMDTIVRLVQTADDDLRDRIAHRLPSMASTWVERFSDAIASEDDDDARAGLARVLRRSEDSRSSAVKRLRDRAAGAGGADPTAGERVAAALKELGGEEAYESLQAILHDRYIQPSDKLREVSQAVFEETLTRMRRNYATSMTLNRIMFAVGLVVTAAGLLLIAFNRGNQLFGATGVVAGLGTLVSMFFAGPLKRIQGALVEIVQVEVAYVSFMHRLLQARSVFEQDFIARDIQFDKLARFDELLSEAAQSTVAALGTLRGAGSEKG